MARRKTRSGIRPCTKPPAEMTDIERAAEATRRFLDEKDTTGSGWQKSWKELAAELGYPNPWAAQLAVYRYELAPLGQVRGWPTLWRRRAAMWDAELAEAAAAQAPVRNRPELPGYRRFAVDRVPPSRDETSAVT